MKKILFTMLLFVSFGAQSQPILFIATPTSSSVSGFEIEFNDTGDGLLQSGEITAFSGVDFFSAGSLVLSAPGIIGVPEISGFSTGGSVWSFLSASLEILVVDPIAWSYQLEVVAAPVPEPGVLLLMASGLFMAFAVRRRRLTPEQSW